MREQFARLRGDTEPHNLVNGQKLLISKRQGLLKIGPRPALRATPRDGEGLSDALPNRLKIFDNST